MFKKEDVLGSTPMISISYKYKGKENKVYVKLEYFNLTGSIKDRVAYYIINKAKERGELTEGMPIIEATSGNTGIALAAIGSYYKHPVNIFMPNWVSKERINIMKGYGAKVYLFSKEDGGFTFEEKSWYATGRLGVVLKNNLFNYIKDKDKFQSWQDILENGNPFKTEDVNFWRTNYNCVSAINNCNDDTKCREYVLKYIEALRKLTKTPLKTVSMGYLTSSQRLKGRMSIFNPM